MRKFLYQLGVLLTLGGLILTTHSFVYAQTIEELQTKISAKNEEIRKLEESIKQHQDDLVVLGAQKKTLKNSITELDVLQRKLNADLKLTQVKVDTTDLNLRKLGSEISIKENEIDTHRVALREALQAIYQRDEYSLPEVALSNESFSGFWGDLESLNQFSDKVEQNVGLLRVLKGDLEDKNLVQEAEKKKLIGLKTELGNSKKITDANKKEQAKLLAQTSNQETKFKKMLNAELALKDAVEQELRSYETSLKFILDPSSIPPRGTKVFSPPLEQLVITQQFGKTSSSGRLYASGTHNGTDFRALVGTPVKAMLSGTVIGTGDTDIVCKGASYGKWVLIRHNNGLATLYGHFSVVKVSQGQAVDTGELIGYSGNTGYSTGPHLHVTVFAAAAVKVESLPSKACGGRVYTMPLAAINAYLDPMDYL